MADQPILSPVLNYALILPDGCNVHELFLRLKQLEEEDPQLHIVWNDRTGEIHAQVMGEVQIEILKSLIAQRFGVDVDFGSGSIVYKETITEPVEGVGHFEPLRHYAEVHLLLEPLPVGSGLVFETNCSEDVLDKNWQRLVRTHLEEKRHVGVLTGSGITDMRITLVAGRAHPKHTEGGDFRQATYRAVRQGLRSTQNRLLEPWYDFRLEIPSPNVGRALADIQKMYGEFNPPEPEGELTLVTGRAPVATMRDYQMAVVAYTKGYGRLSCSLSGYAPCHNASEIIERIGYDPENDFENPTGSVFVPMVPDLPFRGIRFGIICMWQPEPGVKNRKLLMKKTEARLSRRRWIPWVLPTRMSWRKFLHGLMGPLKGTEINLTVHPDIQAGPVQRHSPAVKRKTGITAKAMVKITAEQTQHCRENKKKFRKRRNTCLWMGIILFLPGMI